MVEAPDVPDVERRGAVRHDCDLEAVSCPLDAPETLCWGATVQDISTGGIGLSLCYPFKPGTFLAITLQPAGQPYRLLGKVIHVSDQADGTWFVGCEFVKELDRDTLQEFI
jgi:hypothetical protein